MSETAVAYFAAGIKEKQTIQNLFNAIIFQAFLPIKDEHDQSVEGVNLIYCWQLSIYTITANIKPSALIYDIVMWIRVSYTNTLWM